MIKKHLPKGYKESMNWGVIAYEIPLKVFPDTYNGQPLCYAALAAQKNHNALYLMVPYGDSTQRTQLEDAFAAIGKKLRHGQIVRAISGSRRFAAAGNRQADRRCAAGKIHQGVSGVAQKEMRPATIVVVALLLTASAAAQRPPFALAPARRLRLAGARSGQATV